MSSTSKPPLGAGAIDGLDAAIAALEAERVNARRVLGVSHGTRAEQLAVALKMLDDKIVEARQQRDALAERLGRTQRMQELTDEMRALRPELESLVAAGEQGERLEELRARALAIQAEVTRLKS